MKERLSPILVSRPGIGLSLGEAISEIALFCPSNRRANLTTDGIELGQAWGIIIKGEPHIRLGERVEFFQK